MEVAADATTAKVAPPIKNRLKPIAARVLTDLLLIIATVCVYNAHNDANKGGASLLLPPPSYTIQEAAREGDVEGVARFLGWCSGQEVLERQDEFKKTPLHWAVQAGKTTQTDRAVMIMTHH